MGSELIDKIICRTCLSLIDKNKAISVYTVSERIMLCSSVQMLKHWCHKKLSIQWLCLYAYNLNRGEGRCVKKNVCPQYFHIFCEFDGLPTHICNNCHDMVQNAYEFKILCEKSDKELRRKLIESSNITVKDEIIETINSAETDSNFHEDDKGTLLDEVKLDINLEDGFHKSDSDQNEDHKYSAFENNVKLKPFNCEFCNATFLYKRSLEKHEREHKKPDYNQCQICAKTYSNFRRLSIHVRNVHKHKRSHLCQTCGKQFSLPENLLRHQRIHTGEKPHHCIVCKKRFIQSGELKSHMVTHTAEKPYLCSFCGNKFARKQSLRVHIRRIHTNSHQTHTCGLCGRCFKDQRDLAQHKLIHTGERKHVCKVCSKAFNRKSNLKVHERIHSGQRPHVCSVCQRSFIQKHALNTHVQKTHPS